MSKIRIEDRPQVKRCSMIVIQDAATGVIVGKIIGAYPSDGAGRLHVSLWDYTQDGGTQVQDGSAAGYGYNKLAAALSGLKFAGITLQDEPSCWVYQLLEAGYKATTL